MKPKSQAGYSASYTDDCERVLLTLISGLGPYCDSLCLVGGLTPRYLVKRRPPEVPEHAGTTDVDIVVDLTVITDTDAYATLEQNLERLGFERAQNEYGVVQSWRWRTKTERGATMIVEFLADDPAHPEIKAKPLPTQRRISALNIPNASLVFDMFETREIAGELLNGKGKIVQKIRYANVVAHSSLKMLSYADRREGKDAHDLIYCLQHADEGIPAVAKKFCEALRGKHAETIHQALRLMQARFASDEKTDGADKDGPIAVADFEIPDDDDGARERKALRRRQVVTVIETLLREIDAAASSENI